MLDALRPVVATLQRLGVKSERQWFDVLSVLRIQQGRLDLGYMHQWAGKLGVFDLLERAFKNV